MCFCMLYSIVEGRINGRRDILTNVKMRENILNITTTKGVRQGFIADSAKIDRSLLCRWLKEERTLNDNDSESLSKFLCGYMSEMKMLADGVQQ